MPDRSLDDPATYEELDRDGMFALVAGLPEQIDTAWRAGWALTTPDAYRDAERIVVLGMGGSGIGGALLEALAVDLGARAPVSIVRGYALPGYVDGRTLVLASSNSGDTEETVAAFDAALGAGARTVAITTGGALLALAREHGAPALTFEWQHGPRAALGWSFASLLGIVCRAGLLPDVRGSLPGALDEMRALRREIAPEVPEPANAAKAMARRLHGTLPVIVGAEALAPVAYRWRTQINENAKSWALSEELPEMNHNQHAGYGLPKDVVGRIHAVILRHAGSHPRIALRIDATLAEMARHGVAAEAVDIGGSGVLAQALRGVLLGDYVSCYLAVLNGVDPSPVPELGALKGLLAGK